MLVDIMHFGIIYNINLNKQIFTLKDKRGLKYFFVPKNIYKILKKYLYKGNFVSFIVNDNTIYKNNKEMHQVKYFREISVPSNARRIKLYSKRDNQKELNSFMNDMNNLMFIDLEMTMPDYGERIHTTELIQASYIITDSNFNVLDKRDYHILPTICRSINRRTSDFLGINDEILNKSGVKYNDFYNVFKEDINKYLPTIVIFGKNDKKYLLSSFELNNVDSLSDKLRFVNLSQLLKNYYELPNDPGLFKMYEELYNVDLGNQKHDAYEDATITMGIYKKFKEIVSN